MRGVAFAVATPFGQAMLQFRFLLRALLVLGALTIALPAAAQKADAPPKPDTYLCPDNLGGAVDCYLQAIEHLYTMCRQVKSIEIIEFGYEKSDEGVNGSKSEYCIDKHKQSITRPYQTALREAGRRRIVVDALRSLHDLWLKALAELRWKPGESDGEYKVRVAQPYEEFRKFAMFVRAELPANKGKPATAAAPASKKSPN
jgi:hypothetical protein